MERSITSLLDDPYPRNKKIRKYLHKHHSEVNYVTFYSSPHFLRRQFYWPTPIKSGNPITNYLLVSLHPDLPLTEGWRSAVSLGGKVAQGPISHYCTSLFNEKEPIPPQCMDNNKLGSAVETVFPASPKYLLVKVLGQGKIIQILCGGDFLPATFASKGIFLALVGRNCNVYSEGALLIQAENGEVELGYRILLDEPPRLINQTIPMPGSIQTRLAVNMTTSDILLTVWLSVVTIVVAVYTLCVRKRSSHEIHALFTGMKHHPGTPREEQENGPRPAPPPLPPLRNYPDYTSLSYPYIRKAKEAATLPT